MKNILSLVLALVLSAPSLSFADNKDNKKEVFETSTHKASSQDGAEIFAGVFGAGTALLAYQAIKYRKNPGWKIPAGLGVLTAALTGVFTYMAIENSKNKNSEKDLGLPDRAPAIENIDLKPRAPLKDDPKPEPETDAGSYEKSVK